MAWCLIIEWNHTETHGISTSIHFLFLLCFHSQYIVRLTIFVIISIHAVYPVHGLYIPRRTPFSYHTDMAKCAHGGNDYFTIVWMKMAEHNKRFASMQLKLQFCSSFFFIIRSVIILLRQRCWCWCLWWLCLLRAFPMHIFCMALLFFTEYIVLAIWIF